ncbi:hypothetical protein GCM10027294_31530 [Marinactinospora endophytica]
MGTETAGDAIDQVTLRLGAMDVGKADGIGSGRFGKGHEGSAPTGGDQMRVPGVGRHRYGTAPTKNKEFLAMRGKPYKRFRVPSRPLLRYVSDVLRTVLLYRRIPASVAP